MVLAFEVKFEAEVPTSYSISVVVLSDFVKLVFV